MLLKTDTSGSAMVTTTPIRNTIPMATNTEFLLGISDPMADPIGRMPMSTSYRNSVNPTIMNP
ncbi:MAG: hypothetical protein WCQ23_05420 [Candidatus Methanomethylophilaceae archaeon]|jgi:hypothetical protein